MTQYNDPRNGAMKSGSSAATGAGLLLIAEGTTNTFDLCADGEVAIAVTADEQQRGEDNAIVAGGTVSYYPLGGVVWVQSEASQTYDLGTIVYVGDGGQCIDANDHTSKALGVYVGDGGTDHTSTTAGVLIPVNTAGAALS